MGRAGPLEEPSAGNRQPDASLDHDASASHSHGAASVDYQPTGSHGRVHRRRPEIASGQPAALGNSRALVAQNRARDALAGRRYTPFICSGPTCLTQRVSENGSREASDPIRD